MKRAMRDLTLQNRAVWEAVIKENTAQLEKWGIQDHDPFRWLAFVTEEVGELADAISEWEFRGGAAAAVAHEAIQAATLCLKIAEMFMEVSDGSQ